MSQVHLSEIVTIDRSKNSRMHRFRGMLRLSFKQLKHRFLESLLILLGISLGVGVLTGMETVLRFVNSLEGAFISLDAQLTSIHVRPATVDVSALFRAGGSPAIPVSGQLSEPVQLTLDHLLRAREEVPLAAYAAVSSGSTHGTSIIAIDGEPWVPPISDENNAQSPTESSTTQMLSVGTGGFFSSSAPVFQSPSVSLSYMTPDDLVMRNREMVAGRWMTWDEFREGSPIVIIEQEDIDILFPGLPPEEVIGHTFTTSLFSSSGPRDQEWRIIGVVAKEELPEWMQGFDFGSDSVQVYAPYTAGDDMRNVVNGLSFAPLDQEDMGELVNELEVFFASIFGEGRLDITNPLEQMADIRTQSRGTSITLMGLAALALLVAAINILNLFTARVIRRARSSAMSVALGAERRSLFHRILGEALLLGIGGSLIGLVIAMGVVQLFKTMLFSGEGVDVLETVYGTLRLTLADVGFGLSVGIIVSLLFGLYPAFINASMDPAEGLRTE